MSERHFEQSMNPKEHIQSELEDAGISHPSEWRKALDLETPLEGEEGMTPDRRSFEKLLTYLEGDKRVSDDEKIKKFSETKDSIERLEILRTMSLGDAVSCIKDYSGQEGSYRYLANRLDFYQKFVTGKATKNKKQTKSEWDDKKREYVQVEKEYPIDASNASPKTIRLGMWRDMLYASMQGTPEMGAIKIATKRINQSSVEKAAKTSGQATKIKSAVELFGYYSGIQEGSLG